jgi:probable F420-dependent oxidoreductase
MELGIGLPTSGPLAGAANIARVAQEAERLGYASLWTYERLLRPLAPVSVDGGPPQPLPDIYRVTYEPLETLSFVAGVTDTITLGTSVVNGLFHPPVVLARRFATLDQFARGRVIAGLGQGWLPQEFETAGVPLSRRGAGMDELVAAMRACWGPDPVSYEGRFYRIEASQVNPKPVQEHLPILIGAMTPAGIRRAARIADGLNPIAFSLDQVREVSTAFRDAVGAGGRDPASVTVVARANVPLTTEPLGDGRPFLGGSPDEVAADLARVSELDVDHVFVTNVAQQDLETELKLLAQLREATAAVTA